MFNNSRLGTLKLLLICATATAAAQSGELVAGRVVSTDGRPIAHAVVSLTKLNNGAELETVRSGSDGRYRFGPMPSGRYSLGAQAPGYIGGLYQQHGQYSTAIALGAKLATNSLDLQLSPAAVIYGRVTDEAGDAVHNATVTLFRQALPGTSVWVEDADAGVQATRFQNRGTGDTGEFRLENVPPGRYFLSVSGTPWYATHVPLAQHEQVFGYRAAVDPALDVAYPELFYPGATRPEEASSIHVTGGESIAANMQMHAERAVSVEVQIPAADNTGARGIRFPQLTRTVFGVVEQVQAQVETNGTSARLTGLVPGRYGLQEYQQSGALQHGEVEVTGAGATVDLANLDKGKTSATVKVRVVGGYPLPAGVQVRLRGSAGSGQNTVNVGENGEAVMPILDTGTFRVEVSQGGRELPLIGLTVNGKAAPDLRLRVPERSEMLTVEASVALHATQIAGFVRSEGKPVSGSMVVLVPAGPAAGTELFRRDQSDLDGSFLLNGVSPGNYLLVAVDDGWSLAWTNTSVMARYLTSGIPVTVSPNAGAVISLSESVVPHAR